MDNLQILDLSETLLKELPSLSNLTNLRELYLKGCEGLKSVADLGALTKLEILDLSGSLFAHLPSLKKLGSLRHLLLKGCSGLKDIQHGQILDILGAAVNQLPYGISKVTCLERFDLPNVKYIHGVDNKNIKPMEEESNGCDWGISSFSAEVVGNEMRPTLIVSGSQFLKLLGKYPSLWDSNFNKFHLSVRPIKELDEKSVLRFRGDDFLFRDFYFRTNHNSEPKEQRLLEISGFSNFPEVIGFDEILSHANNIFFSDNTFKTWTSYLAASSFYQMKGCWIEKCGKLEYIFLTEEMDSNVLNAVELLWVSNDMNLKSVMSQNPQNEVFRNLKQLYLGFCPNLSTVLSLSHLPENLKIIEIKFCDKLRTIFEQNPQQKQLRSLETLHLRELPELKNIGRELPSLQTLKISDCPELEKLEETIKLAESLQTLWLSNVVDLKTIHSFKELKHVSLDSCPNLVIGFCSSQLPNNLETLRIRSCDSLETVFEEGTASKVTLQNLQTVHLQGLPKLRSFGATLPALKVRVIVDCLKYESDV